MTAYRAVKKVVQTMEIVVHADSLEDAEILAEEGYELWEEAELGSDDEEIILVEEIKDEADEP